MKGRKQKISEDSYRKNSRAELEGYFGVQTFMWITENNITSFNAEEHGLLEQILSPSNLNLAYKKVKANKGGEGIDKMDVESLKDYLVKHKDALTESLLDGSYRPNPVRRVEIPKDNNQKRILGIPTVIDRMIQQAIQQILSPIYERQFSDYSYGFRPKRSTHQALQVCQSHISSGYAYAVDIDLEKFFDTVNHSKLIELLSRTVKDGRVVSLIHKYLNAGVLIGSNYEATTLGVPQGSPLSPLLSNIMLNELDKELEKRGHRFVRYADDLVIFTKSQRSADRVSASLSNFIEKNLQLKVNRKKTQTGYVSKLSFLGYSFYMRKGKGRLRIAPKSIRKLKESIRILTNRNNGWSYTRRKWRLSSYIRGWVNYFKLADMKHVLKTIDEWYRRRLRMVIWTQWKRIRTRIRNLMKLGLAESTAIKYGNTRKGAWCIANSPILALTITNARLQKAGYLSFVDHYQRVKVII